MQEIEDYAAARGILPATVVQSATGHSGMTWAKWKGGATCSLRTAEKIREFMQANPAAKPAESQPTPDEDAA